MDSAALKIRRTRRMARPGSGLILLGWMALMWASALRGADDLATLIQAWKNDEVIAALKANPELLNAPDKDGFPPLITIAAQNNRKLVEMLLELKPNINVTDKEGLTALMRTAKNGYKDLAQLLVENGADRAIKSGEGKTAADYARERGHPDIVALLQTAGPTAVTPGVKVIPFALPAGGEPTDPTTGETFLQALSNWHSAIAQKLLAREPTMVNAVNAKQQTALHIAAQQCNAPMIQFLLEHGADVTLRDQDGETPLHAAARGNAREGATILMQYGSDPSVKNKAGQTAEDVARATEHFDVIGIIQNTPRGLPAGTAPASDRAQLSQAIAGGDLPAVQALVTAAPGLVDQAGPDGRTPLYQALAVKPEIAAFLTPRVKNLNAGDPHGWRPLHLAAESGREDLVELLLAGAADPNCATQPAGQTSLYLAASYGYTTIARQLLAANANASLGTAAGITPLHRAAEGGYLDVVSLLIRAKAAINAQDQKGRTALDYAIAARRADVIAFLLKYGASGSLPVPAAGTVGTGGAEGAPVAGGSATAGKADPQAVLDKTAAADFLQACQRNDDAKINALLTANPNLIYAQTANLEGPLYFLAHKCSAATAARILDLGLPVDGRQKYGRSALHRSAEFANVPLVKLLIERGAEINAVDADKNTPLHYAAGFDESADHDTVVGLLLDHHADATLKNLDGQTPYGKAVAQDKPQGAAALKARGITQ